MILNFLRTANREIRYDLLAAVFRRSNKKSIIVKDAERWIDPYQLRERLPMNFKTIDLIFYLFHRYPEFRNLFYYRFYSDPARNHFLYKLLERLFPPRDSVKISVNEIGSGLFIQHGTASSIGADKIGENCWINQHVTIGFSEERKAPIFGNGVVIRPGARIFGGITIGDNSIVGANCVVLKDVPPNCTVVGVPARIIRRNGQRVDEKL